MEITLEKIELVKDRTGVSYKEAKEALEKNESIYSLILERGILTKEKLDQILMPENMIKPVKNNFD